MNNNDEKNKILIGEKTPEFLELDGIKYKRLISTRHDHVYRITYVEYDGEDYNFSQKLLDINYKLVDIIPKPDNTYPNSVFSNPYTYVCTIDELCGNVLDYIRPFPFTILYEIITKEAEFTRELTSLLNRYSKENNSNTPDFILADYLIGCLRTFNISINSREKWYGRESKNNESINIEE